MYDFNDIDFKQLHKEMDEETCAENSGLRDKKQKIEEMTKWNLKPNFYVSDLGIVNDGPYVSYSFSSFGESFFEMERNGWIEEVNSEGNIVKEYPMLSADKSVKEKCRDVIDAKLNKEFNMPVRSKS